MHDLTSNFVFMSLQYDLVLRGLGSWFDDECIFTLDMHGDKQCRLSKQNTELLNDVPVEEDIGSWEEGALEKVVGTPKLDGWIR